MKRHWTDHTTDTLLVDNISLPNRTIILNDGICEDSLELFLKGFHLLGPGPITIRMNSGGGDVNPGLAMIDIIRNHKASVTIEVWGRAESMAAVILQAADRRLISKGSHLMLHSGVDEPPVDMKKNIKAYMKLSDLQDNLCDELVLSRIQQKHKSYSWSRFRTESQFDLYFDSAGALKWGLVDDII